MPLLLLLACSDPVDQPPLDLLLHGGTVRLDASSTSDMIGIRGGIVAAVGEEAEALAGPDTERIDLGGAAVLPGFHDNHTHMLAGSFVFDKLLVVGVTRMSTLVNQAASYASENPDPPWVVGYGWVLSSMETPSGVALDEAVPDRPAAIFDASGHALLVNSLAMELAGITADTPDPADGEIARDEDGNPTGLLLEGALSLVSPLLLEAFGDEMLGANLPDAVADFNQAGITSVSEILAVPGFDLGRPWIYAELEAADALDLRVHYYMPAFALEDLAFIEEVRGLYDGSRLRFAGVKLWVDGSTGSGEAWSLEPAAGDPEHYGSRYFSTADLEAFVDAAEEGGYGLKFHVNGDAAVRAVLDAVETVRDGRGAISQSHLLEHVALFEPSDLSRLAGLGLCASVQPALALVGPFSDQAELWEGERMDRAWDYQGLLGAGVPLALGTDWPVWPTPDAMVNLWTATEGLGDKGISMADAFHAYTAAAAECMGLAGDYGCLRKGCHADWLRTDHDPFAAEPGQVSEISVDQVWISGSRVH
jgi:predicted amidohydrolase YtcJ